MGVYGNPLFIELDGGDVRGNTIVGGGRWYADKEAVGGERGGLGDVYGTATSHTHNKIKIFLLHMYGDGIHGLFVCFCDLIELKEEILVLKDIPDHFSGDLLCYLVTDTEARASRFQLAKESGNINKGVVLDGDDPGEGNVGPVVVVPEGRGSRGLLVALPCFLAWHCLYPLISLFFWNRS